MSKIRSIHQKTHNPYLNYYELEAVRRDGGVFP